MGAMYFAVFIAIIMTFQPATSRSPILIFPGIMGTRLEVKDTREGDCDTEKKFEELWISNVRFTRVARPGMNDKTMWQCGADELSLNFDFEAQKWEPKFADEVEVRPMKTLKAVEVLSSHMPAVLSSKLDYLKDLVDYFVKNGYKREENIRAAGYDWRLAADELERRGYYDNVKKEIEDMYNTYKKPVTLIAHSMGGPVSLHFLTGYKKIDQKWKDKHIWAYVTLSGAWSGGVRALAGAFMNVLPERLGTITPSIIVPALRSLESGPWIFPKDYVFKNRVLIKTKTKSYTAEHYGNLFDDIGQFNIYRTYVKVKKINDHYPPPNVDTFCFFGVGVDTPEKYTFAEDFDKKVATYDMKPPKVTFGDGDGSVNTISSNVCLDWGRMERHRFNWIKFNKVDHDGIVKAKRVLEELRCIVKAWLD